MKQAYAPALEVSARTLIEKVRELPLKGQAQVEVGDRVHSETTVLTAALPGDLSVIRIADRMGFDAEDIAEHVQFAPGDRIEKGQLLCEIRTFFGLFKSQLHSPTEGEVEFFTSRNAHLGLRLESKPISKDAYISGEVVAVEAGKRVTIRTSGALIQGVFGVGGERQGTICVLDVASDVVVEPRDLQRYKERISAAVLIGGSQFSLSAIQYAAKHGATAIVTGSIDASVLAAYVGREIGVSITGDEDIPTTLIVTEGFGKLAISKRVLDLAETLEGRTASVNGATQVRAGATRPEIIVASEEPIDASQEVEPKILRIGAPVRVIRVPYFGAFGEIVELPSELHRVESGAEVRVLKAKLESGEEVVVPRANVELL